ncbi:membrane protein required for colicin V production [Endobacter medicaginis]|uniref:Membrane protein required for colicin V production n=3 Tax=Endobacter medicaginis TaxID=1181271 RepID=A0A839V0P8_9PROT|nr:membrane protein required for colicin V production [Endobacter medicaginis]MCX5474456.1 CvpA family protein [Endobacter medicaginis]
MNGFDIALLALTAISALAGLWRGLLRELLGIGAWIVAVWLAIRFLPQLTALGLHVTDNAQLAAIGGAAIGFVAALVAFSLLTSLVSRAVSASPLGGLDRLAGFGFGLARAVAAFVGAYMLASVAAPIGVWPDVVQKSQSLPYIYGAAKRAQTWLPDAFRVHLEVPGSMTTPSPAPDASEPDGSKL